MVRRTIAVLLAGMCLLAGCTGDPEPKIDDPTPTPTSASPTATATTEAADPGQQYRDFIDAYVGAISESLSTGDASTWLAMSSTECVNCVNLAHGVRDAYANGGRIEGASWQLRRSSFDRAGDLGDVWRVDVDRAREVWLDGDGLQTKVVPAGGLSFEFAITMSGARLEVRELKPLDS